ncbi:MAG: DNA alkylation repair protein [Patescibacteria group bacterium]
MKEINKIITELTELANNKQAEILQRFFKTGKGEYGEGDIFLGIKVPLQRKLVKKYPNLPLKEVLKLLGSKVHEHRLVGLLILVNQYQRADMAERDEIYQLYLNNTININNWDLVDLTAPNIVGQHLLDKRRQILYQLARSKNIWERRIAILATLAFIRNNDFADTLKIANILFTDDHDLIHKGVGWMLREVGKRDLATEERFLMKHYRKMPRTMLRYAIEKLPEKKRQFYLKK